jgi:hypothetical protein
MTARRASLVAFWALGHAAFRHSRPAPTDPSSVAMLPRDLAETMGPMRHMGPSDIGPICPIDPIRPNEMRD